MWIFEKKGSQLEEGKRIFSIRIWECFNFTEKRLPEQHLPCLNYYISDSCVKLKQSFFVVAVSLIIMLFNHSSLPEPTSVDIHVDGINDICTKGGDINFVFTGFSVNGKVRLLYLYLFYLMLIQPS